MVSKVVCILTYKANTNWRLLSYQFSPVYKQLISDALLIFVSRVEVLRIFVSF